MEGGKEGDDLVLQTLNIANLLLKIGLGLSLPLPRCLMRGSFTILCCKSGVGITG